MPAFIPTTAHFVQSRFGILGHTMSLYSCFAVFTEQSSTKYRYSRDDALQIIGTILPVLPVSWIYGIGLQEIQNRVFSTIT